MNSDKGHNIQQAEEYRSLLVLDEISKNGNVTQRDLSKNLGIALGLVNSYIKNLVSKGYITVLAIPSKRYKYYLTPIGFTEKTRLTYEHLKNFTNLYRVARRDFGHLFRDMESSGIKKIVFCGVDEIAEIAYLSLKETTLELAAIADDEKEGTKFFGQNVISIKELKRRCPELIVITSHRAEELRSALLSVGVSFDAILDISGSGWIKKAVEIKE
ncbi:MAG: winged helix-turn-helix transcriptional regulator [Thermodesulfobacteriota bacterium]